MVEYVKYVTYSLRMARNLALRHDVGMDLSQRGAGAAIDRPQPAQRRFRRAIAVLLVTPLVVLGALTWVAWHFSNQALGIERAVTTEAVAVPAGEGRVRLTGDRFVGLPGRYGLAWEGGYAELGEVFGDVDSGDPVTATRRYTPAVGVLAGAAAARVDQNTFTGDPRTARGLDFSDVVVDGELGGLPAWYVPAAPLGTAALDTAAAGDRGRTWVVFVHGRGADRREALRYLPTWHRADRSEQRARLRGLILDSPVMDWRDVFVYQGGESGLPSPISRLAIWNVDPDRYEQLSADWLAEIGALGDSAQVRLAG